MDERERRIGENEALFRMVNDEVRGLNRRFEANADPMSVICECGRVDCTDRLELQPPEYEAVRENGRLFAIKPGHDDPQVERVVERHANYWIVEKDEGAAAELAEASDPRS